MHIGFDISQTGSNKAGCGYYAHAMIQALLKLAPENSYSLFPDFGDFYFDVRMPVRNPWPGRNVQYGPRHYSREAAGRFWTGQGVEDALGRPDIIHANNFWCPVQVCESRVVYTFYDMGFVIDPSWTTEQNRIGCFDGVFRSAVAADWIVAISKASRDHYLSVFPHFPEERIRVIYPCSRFAEVSLKGTRPRALAGIEKNRFWLSVGTIEPRKNQRRLASAYARFREHGGAPIPLVFAGGEGWLMEDFRHHLETLDIAGDVIMTGYITDEELIWLYKNCYANLYPSLFEGFGLPVLEGMQFGAPALVSTASSLPEVAGDAALLLDPEDIEGWARAMLDLSRNQAQQEQLHEKALKQAARFNWQAGAARLLALYEEAVRMPKRQGM